MRSTLIISIVTAAIFSSLSLAEEAEKPVQAVSNVPHQLLLEPATLKDLVEMQRYLLLKEIPLVRRSIQELSAAGVQPQHPDRTSLQKKLASLEQELESIDSAAREAFKAPADAAQKAVEPPKEIIALGDVNRPGIYRFSDKEPCTLMHLIFKMGGLPQNVDGDDITIRRVTGAGSDKVMQVNIEKALATGDPKEDVPLQNGDRVIITR